MSRRAARIVQTQSLGEDCPTQPEDFSINVKASGLYQPSGRNSSFAGFLDRMIGLLGLLRLHRGGVAVTPLKMDDPR